MSKRTLKRSNIGYTGIGANGNPVDWYYGVNPGGFGCSNLRNCPGCWSHSMCHRSRCPDCKAFKVHYHPERLEEPGNTRTGGLVLWDFCNDIADRARGFAHLDGVWDMFWSLPRFQFIILTKQHQRLASWIRHHASNLSFGWTDLERTPMECGDLIHMDDIRMRDQCGWVGDDGKRDWCCLCPTNEGAGKDESCDGDWGCPIAYEVLDRETLAKHDLGDEYDYDEEGYTDNTGWMELYKRPHNAAASNVWVGFTARNQDELHQVLRAVCTVRHANPYAHIWLSLEPLWAGLDFNTHLYPDDPQDGLKTDWLKRTLELQSGGTIVHKPYIDGIIVGQDKRRTAPGTDTLDHVRSVVEQCQAAEVPVYCKQVWLPRPRTVLPPKLYMDPIDFPEDLRLRSLPWSMPEVPHA
jgi:protein gp37